MIYIFDVPFSLDSIYSPSPIYILKHILQNRKLSSVTKDLNLLFVKYLFEERTIQKYLSKDKIFWKFLYENITTPQEIREYLFNEIKLLLRTHTGNIETLEQLEDFNFEKYLRNKNSPLVDFINGGLDFIEEGIKIFLISVRYWVNLFSALLIAKHIKNKYKDSKIILGGSYFITTTEDNIKYILEKFNEVDYISNIQAEVNLVELVNNILNKKGNICEIPNLFYLNNKKAYFTFSKYPEYVENILIEKHEFEEYFEPRTIGIANGLGCNWNKCVFCNFQKISPQLIISPDKVVGFIEETIDKLNCFSFRLNIDNLQEKDYRELCNEITKRNLNKKIRILSFCKPTKYSRNFFNDISNAGVRELAFGAESFSDNLLKKMRKGANSKIIISDIKAAHEAGIYMQINMIYDFPNITKEDIKNNIKALYLLSEDINSLVSFSFELYYKTHIFFHKEDFGISSDMNIKKMHYIHKVPFNIKNNNIDDYYLFMLKLFTKYFRNKKRIKRNIATYNYCAQKKIDLKLKLCNFIIVEDKDLFVFESNESLLGAILNKKMIEFLKRYDRKQNFTMININNPNGVIKRFIQFCIKENLVILDNEHVNENEYNKITFRDYEQLYKDEIPKQTIS